MTLTRPVQGMFLFFVFENLTSTFSGAALIVICTPKRRLLSVILKTTRATNIIIFRVTAILEVE